MTPFMTPNSCSSRSRCVPYNTISVGVFSLHDTASALGSSQLPPSITHLWAPKAPAHIFSVIFVVLLCPRCSQPSCSEGFGGVLVGGSSSG